VVYKNNLGKYSIIFPGAPKLSSEIIPTEKMGDIILYSAKYLTKEYFYDVSYFDIKPGWYIKDEALEDFTRIFLKDKNAKLIHSDNIYHDEYPGKELIFYSKSEGLYTRVIWFFVSRRIYMVEYESIKDDVNSERVDQFIQSFDFQR
jgi:hypothetical protein